MDGDGVPVVYSDPSWKVEIADSGSQSFEAFVQHGRARQPILVQLVDEKGSVQFEHAVRLEERGEVLPATQPWLVAIGARWESSKGR